MRKTYTLQPEREGTWTLTLALYDRKGHDLCLHLLFDEEVGLLQLTVNDIHLAILAQTDLMQQLAALPPDVSLEECERQVQRLGFKSVK